MAERAGVPSVITSPAPGNPVLSPLPFPPPFPLPLQASSRPLEQEGTVEGCGEHWPDPENLTGLTHTQSLGMTPPLPSFLSLA